MRASLLAVLSALDSITTAAYDSIANHDAPKRSEWQEGPAALGTTACGAFSLGRTVLAALDIADGRSRSPLRRGPLLPTAARHETELAPPSPAGLFFESASLSAPADASIGMRLAADVVSDQRPFFVLEPNRASRVRLRLCAEYPRPRALSIPNTT